MTCAALGEIPESRVGWTGRLYQRWILRGLRRARAIACVSAQAGEELRRVAGVPEERIAIVPNALNYPYRPMSAAEAEAHLRALELGEARPFFLHVGGNQWYKNRSGVLRLFAELLNHPDHRAHRLVMAGKPWTEQMRQLAAHLNLHDRAIERVAVSNEQLRALYSSAEALLFPRCRKASAGPSPKPTPAAARW